MNLSLVSIDNVYDDPDHVRDYALSVRYNIPGVDPLMNVLSNGSWPGITSIDTFKFPKIDSLVSSTLGKVVRQVYNSGKFRLSSEGEIAKSPLHVDTKDFNTYAGVLYLNKVTDSIPGTIFYTHKETNTNFADAKTYEKILENNDLLNVDKWIVDSISHIKYNRLIIYPANRYHGPGISFGKVKEDARLVQLFLWEIL